MAGAPPAGAGAFQTSVSGSTLSMPPLPSISGGSSIVVSHGATGETKASLMRGS
jgi:hypothetical protein